MRRVTLCLSAFFAAMIGVTGISATGAAAETRVVATIPAVHSIVSGVLGNTASAHLMIPGGASPHTYTLKPSNAQALADAQLVVWVGPDLETFLEDELGTLAPNATVITWLEADGLTLHDWREGGLWDAHAHDHDAHADEDKGHGDAHAGHDHHADHDDHAHKGHDDDHHDDHAHESHKDNHDDHDHAAHASSVDGHVWLDPRNAIILSKSVADALAGIDPANAETYAANHAAQADRLNALDADIQQTLAGVQDVPFIVFHDAYQYFESRYGLAGVGSVTVSPEVAPGAARVRAIQERIGERNAKCVFAEPQFKPSILRAVTEGTQARSGVLDPVGADIEPGADMYSQLMQQLATDLSACLTDPA